MYTDLTWFWKNKQKKNLAHFRISLSLPEWQNNLCWNLSIPKDSGSWTSQGTLYHCSTTLTSFISIYAHSLSFHWQSPRSLAPSALSSLTFSNPWNSRLQQRGSTGPHCGRAQSSLPNLWQPLWIQNSNLFAYLIFIKHQAPPVPLKLRSLKAHKNNSNAVLWCKSLICFSSLYFMCTCKNFHVRML